MKISPLCFSANVPVFIISGLLSGLKFCSKFLGQATNFTRNFGRNMTIVFGFCIGLCSVAIAKPDYQDGDLIFHRSQTSQSKAILEATGSPWSHVGILFEDAGQWYVAEAVQPVRITKLSSFLKRGTGGHYRTYRLPGLQSAQKQTIRNYVEARLGTDYDLYFEWTEDRIYCSELVYKAFLDATGIELGTVQKFRDLKLDGPRVREMIRRRLTDTGRQLNLDEPIVTPISQMLDSDLTMVIRSGP